MLLCYIIVTIITVAVNTTEINGSDSAEYE